MSMTYKQFVDTLKNIEDDYYSLYMSLEIESEVTAHELELIVKQLTLFYREMLEMPHDDLVSSDHVKKLRDIKDQALTYPIDEKYYPTDAADNKAIIKRMSLLLTDLSANQREVAEKPVTPKQIRKQGATQGSESPHVLRFIEKHGETFKLEKIQLEQEKARQKLRSKSPSPSKK